MLKHKFFGLLLCVFFLGTPLLAQYTILHSFSGASSGYDVQSNLVLVGATLYGTAYNGGAGNGGILFKVGIDGNGFQIIHDFWYGSDTMCYRPQGSLRVVGSTLYGIVTGGGYYGAVYKIDTDGNNFAVVHGFNNVATDGKYPKEAPIISGSTFYGLTSEGGANNKGTIYKMDLDGNNFTILHSFAGGDLDGQTPTGGLLLDGSTLYGMTSQGGPATGESPNGYGTLFKIGTDGNNFQVLHFFAAGTSDGYYPDNGSLLLDGGMLYGMTMRGGASGYGAIFKVDTSGNNFGLVASGGGLNGYWPHGSLILQGGFLCGLMSAGGTFQGTLFRVGTGGGFTVLHNFGDTGDGSIPDWSLIYSGGYFYGTTSGGGASGNYGTVFKLAPCQTDIAVGLTPDNTTPAQGATVNFTVTVTNNGPEDATGVQVQDALNGSLQYSSWSGDGTYYPATGVWDIGPLADGASATVTLTATVCGSGTLLNTAALRGLDGIDSNSANDSKTVQLNTIHQKQLVPPILADPASGQTDLTSPVKMRWEDTNGNPQEVKYKLRLKKQGGSYVNTTLPQNSYQFSKSGLALGKTYYWNVQAVGNGTSSTTSAWANGGVDFSFTMAPPVTLIAPTLTQPANNAAGQPSTVTLKWTDPNSNELHYKVRFKVAGGAYTVTTLGPDFTGLVKTGLKAGKTYYWSVMAVGNGTTIKSSAWPADFKFTT